MYILGIHTGHDAAACLFRDDELIAFCKEERVSRIKNDGGFFELQAVPEVLRIGGIQAADVDVLCATRMKFPQQLFTRTANPARTLKRKLLGQKRDLNLASQMVKMGAAEETLLDLAGLRKVMGLRPDTRIHFSNHHYCHVLAAWYFSDWNEGDLYISCDGGGDGAQYSAYVPESGGLRAVVGGEQTLREKPQNGGASVGLAYAFATELCGFKPNRHEGKLTGLAAFGKPVAAPDLKKHWRVTEDGAVESDFKGAAGLKEYMREAFRGLSREDMAASIQHVTEDVVLEWVSRLRSLFPASRIGMAGGVFSNVRLNQKVAELPGMEEVFIFPAMGDEGLPVGACVDWLLAGGGSLRRRRLEHLYLGYPYTGADLIEAASQGGFPVAGEEEPAQRTAELLQEGKVGAIFYGGMEMGPRALGARSILASPADRGVNDSINARLQRTEFMPFAPFVRECDAETVFGVEAGNRYACRFMTITTDVAEEWQDRIPAVVHVDGTARPQIIYRDDNSLYYDILTRFKEISGLPCLVNTSFNAHEEPIINTPREALTALADNRIDFLVCEAGLVFQAD